MATAKPPTPQELRVTARSARGITLTWAASATARRYEVRVATDPEFTRDAKTFTTPDNGTRLTLNSLNPETTYYFKVRARKSKSARSAYTDPVEATTRTAGARITVMTFNVLSAARRTEHPWQERVAAVAETITRSGADVVGAQEAFATTDYPGSGGLPQWESLRRQLARYGYDRALTGSDGKFSNDCPEEEECWVDEYEQHGAHIYYNTKTLAPVGRGGNIDVDNDYCEWDDRAAVWQIFRTLDGTATEFLVVDTHLYYEGIRERGDYERCRKGQVKRILAKVARADQLRDLPLVLLGDLNSFARQTPVKTLLNSGLVDAAGVDVPRTNGAFSSFHGYRSPLPKVPKDRIDYVMVSGSIGVERWKLVAALDSSRRRLVGPIPSDHHPIIADLVLPGQAAPSRWLRDRLR